MRDLNAAQFFKKGKESPSEHGDVDVDDHGQSWTAVNEIRVCVLASQKLN